MSVSVPKLDTPGIESPGPETLAGVRLAVLVVYHFDAFLQQLVAVHLDYVRRYTPVGTAILGAAVRLDPERRDWLTAQPGLYLPEIGDLPAGHREEHNTALDRLATRAFKDGFTHVATLHQDSFPVRPDWLARLLADLDATTPFAVAERRAFNACMVWDAAWQAQGPTMFPDDVLRDSALTQLLADRPDLDVTDGGVGHLIRATSLGLRWRALRHTGPDILDGMILHLTGSTRIAHANLVPRRDTPLGTKLRKLANPLKPLLPSVLRKTLGRSVGIGAIPDPSIAFSSDGSALEKRAQIARLIADPENYVAASLARSIQGIEKPNSSAN